MISSLRNVRAVGRPARLLDRPLRTNAVVQYALIYLMLLVPGSTFVLVAANPVIYYVLVVAFLLSLFLVERIRESYGIILCGVLLVSTALTRALNGGAGLDSWVELAGCVAITQMAICCDYGRFLDRWIRAVVVFAVISVVLWAFFLLFPSSVSTILGSPYLVDVVGTYPWQTYQYGAGQLFYSWLEIHSTRNCGLYSEPGKYQVVLNSALFILLFWRGKLYFKSERGYKFSLVFVIVALASCQSTTGYIGMVGIFIFYLFFFKRKEGAGSLKLYIFGILLIIVLAMLVDYAINADDSVLYQQVISKLIGDSGFDLSSGTGVYRAEMIELCLAVMSSNPLGIGYDGLNQLAVGYGGGGLVAASLVQFAAVYGMAPWLAVLFLIFCPVFKGCTLSTAVLLAFLFVNTTLAQTHFLYTSLLLIPMYLAIGQGWPLRRVEATAKGGSSWEGR